MKEFIPQASETIDNLWILSRKADRGSKRELALSGRKAEENNNFAEEKIQKASTKQQIN